MNNYNQNTNYGNQYYNNSSSDDYKKSIMKGIIVSIIIVVFFVLFLVYFINISKSDNNKSNDNTNNAVENNDYNQNDNPSENIVSSTEKYIGTSEYGYVKVPINWIKYQGVDGNSSYQYCDPTGTYIISLNATSTNKTTAYDYIYAMYGNLANEGKIEDLKAGQLKLSDYDAYQLSGYYPDYNLFIYIWTFEDGNGVTHYISLEGGEKIEDYLEVPDTFTLNY